MDTTSKRTWSQTSFVTTSVNASKPNQPWWAALAITGLSAVLVLVPGGAAHADGTRDQQWMVDFLDLKEAWKVTKGEGVTVGIVDSGVDADHPDIEKNVEPGMSVIEESNNGLEDPVGHGTGTASLIAGHGHGKNGEDGIVGVAPEAKILPAQVEVGDDVFDPQAMADAIRWLADNGADVIAIGLGHPTADDAEHDAIKYAAIERGIPIISSIGNVGEGLGPDDTEIGRTETKYPVGYEEVVGVSAINQSGKLDDLSMYGPKVAVAAPGSSDVLAAKAGGGVDGFGGTSAAQAITAGVMALLKAKYPDESRMELVWRLTELTTEAGKDGPDDKYGFGIVNPARALTEDPGPLPENLKDPEPTGSYPDDKASSKDDGVATKASGSSSGITWIIAILTVIAIAAAITLILLIRRVKRRRKEANKASGVTLFTPPPRP